MWLLWHILFKTISLWNTQLFSICLFTKNWLLECNWRNSSSQNYLVVSTQYCISSIRCCLCKGQKKRIGWKYPMFPNKIVSTGRFFKDLKIPKLFAFPLFLISLNYMVIILVYYHYVVSLTTPFFVQVYMLLLQMPGDKLIHLLDKKYCNSLEYTPVNMRCC